MQRREFLAATGAALLFPKKLATGVPEPIPDKVFPIRDVFAGEFPAVYCYVRFYDHHQGTVTLGVRP